jgi:hypothetical protein
MMKNDEKMTKNGKSEGCYGLNSCYANILCPQTFVSHETSSYANLWEAKMVKVRVSNGGKDEIFEDFQRKSEVLGEIWKK